MSSPSPLLNFVTRGFQIIFAAVVLGLSVGMIKGQGPTFNSPISLRYTAFVGGATFLAGFVGLAAEWVSVLQGKISLLMDALITLLNIAGGVLLAIQIGVPNCGNTDIRYQVDVLAKNHLFNGGCTSKLKFDDGTDFCWNLQESRLSQLNARCKEAQADAVFLFLTVVILLVSGTMTFLRAKKGY